MSDYVTDPVTFTDHVRCEHVPSGWEYCVACHLDWPCRSAMDAALAEIERLRPFEAAGRFMECLGCGFRWHPDCEDEHHHSWCPLDGGGDQ